MNPTTGEPEPESVVGGIPASVVEGVPASVMTPSTELNPVSPILGIASFADTLARFPEQAVMLSMSKSDLEPIKTYLRLIELTMEPLISR